MLRLWAVLEVLYSSGMRISELTGLNLSSIDRANKTVRVIGKGNKERVVPLGTPAMKVLSQWVKIGRPYWIAKGSRDVTALFIGPRGKRANPRQIREDISRILRTLENTEVSGAHVLRHSRAVRARIALNDTDLYPCLHETFSRYLYSCSSASLIVRKRKRLLKFFVCLPCAVSEK